MAGAVSLLFATLIGVFITPDGIVVGSDTAVSNRSGQESMRQKYCVTGPRTVATLQGVYELTDTETKATLTLYDHFRELCSQTDPSRLPTTLRGQAEYIADRLRSALEAFLKDVPAAEVVRRYASSPVVARVTVSGYEEQGPGSVVIGVGVATDVATNRWQTQVQGLSRLSFGKCGVRFQGQEVVVNAVRSGTDVRIPIAERQKPGVMRLSELMRGTCSDTSIRTAPVLFTEAVRLTMTLGIGFGIPSGTVNLPLDIVVIPNSGPVAVSQIVSW